jgi:hypothetical protein
MKLVHFLGIFLNPRSHIVDYLMWNHGKKMNLNIK